MWRTAQLNVKVCSREFGTNTLASCLEILGAQQQLCCANIRSRAGSSGHRRHCVHVHCCRPDNEKSCITICQSSEPSGCDSTRAFWLLVRKPAVE